MRSKLIISALVVSVSMLAVATGARSEGTTSFSAIVDAKSTLCIPLELQFKRPAGVLKTSLPPVVFSHGRHNSIACVTCHHMWDGRGPVEGCAAEGCHDNLTERQEPNSYFRAFHDKDSPNSCLGCHMKTNLTRKAKNQKLLPISPCANNACHVAQK